MTVILLIAFIGMVAGCFLIFRITPLEFTDGLFSFLTAKPDSIKAQINESTQRKKPHFIRREIMEAQEILRITNRTSEAIIDMFRESLAKRPEINPETILDTNGFIEAYKNADMDNSVFPEATTHTM